MTDATKAALLLGGLIFGLITTSAIAYNQGAKAYATKQEIKIEKEKRNAAEQREAQATAAAAASGRLAAERDLEVGRLKGLLAHQPAPPPSEPVAPDASAVVVASGLQNLGLRPVLLGENPALGLSLPEGRTILGWGREAQRVPPLVARLGTVEQLATAQEGANSALVNQVADLTTALQASHDGRDAERRLAQLRVTNRPWSVGLLVGVDTAGTRRLGAIASRSWGPVQAQVVVLGNQAAIGGAIRF